MTTTATASAARQPSSAYWNDLQEAFADNAAERADKWAARNQERADAARVETKVFAAFSPFEKQEFLRTCYARYNSIAIEGFNWASTLALTAADFAGPLFERQQVEWLKERAKLLADLDEVFATA